ncbi:MAG: hypothetical protein PHX25_04075 [Candidatus Pacebacteria bacterium]|nr:hypothetical protein [Candidatus Paceibacterota bacterium]
MKTSKFRQFFIYSGIAIVGILFMQISIYLPKEYPILFGKTYWLTFLGGFIFGISSWLLLRLFEPKIPSLNNTKKSVGGSKKN